MRFFFFKQKTAYEMRISDWSSDVCSSDLQAKGWAGFATINDLTYINPFLEAALKACDLEIDLTAGSSQPLRQDAVSVVAEAYLRRTVAVEIGRASCRKRVCQYV